jgi:septal ring factor EnvC (AmiA/AmiB activator)
MKTLILLALVISTTLPMRAQAAPAPISTAPTATTAINNAAAYIKVVQAQLAAAPSAATVASLQAQVQQAQASLASAQTQLTAANQSVATLQAQVTTQQTTIATLTAAQTKAASDAQGVYAAVTALNTVLPANNQVAGP